MTEATETKAKKEPTVVETVQMGDGRSVDFAGKRKMVKDLLFIEGQNPAVRFDFRNGESRLFVIPTNLLANFAAHGASQKIGDETAGESDIDDMVVAVDTIIDRLSKGQWTKAREAGDGFSGASIVIRAISEASGKSVNDVKTFLQSKLDQAAAAGQKLTRQALYASFRNPNSKVGAIIARMEQEKQVKQSAVNADDLLGELGS